MGTANAQQLIQKVWIIANGISQLFPIRTHATGDDVIHSGKRQLLMCQMAMINSIPDK